LKKRGNDISGSPPLEKRFFSLGKAASLAAWTGMMVQALGVDIRLFPSGIYLELAVLVILNVAFFILALSFFTLMESTRLGLPLEKTELRTTGIYSLSRNPMYLGFYLLYLASSAYTLNPIVWIASFTAIYIHHMIVKSEEEFLFARFGREYELYFEKTRRYL
jgi:protein-S-isoprenylcysteine O-methyltransferase Ste14